jgi:hypothetical protein
MSFDFATWRVCPHQVFFEKVDLDAIRNNSVKFPRPPSNTSDVAVYVDRVPIPRNGLLSYAQLPFSNPEPYRIRQGVNDLLYISIGFDPPRYAQLTPGPNVRAKDLALDLQRQFPELLITILNKHVLFKSRQPLKGTAFQFHDPRWTDKTSSLPNTARILAAYKSVGIIPGRAAIGKDIFPDWKIERDIQSPLIADKILTFSRSIPNADPIIELNYITSAQYCRRCNGTQLEHDYSITGDTYDVVRDTDLLSQEFDKFLVTKIGSHWKWSWLGSGLIDKIGGKGQTGTVNVNALITIDINQSFSTYQNIKQLQDSGFPQQQVSDAEYPLSLANISVQTLPDDPTVAIVVATVVSRSRENIELKRVIGNPSPFNLTSSSPNQILKFDSGGSFSSQG